ncbi:MAG: hypothetical protein ABSG86_21415 [Thermoguttaceae bacterium]|jgi:hypothetical protein
MSDMPTKPAEQCRANLMALHRQLQEMAASGKCSDQPPRDRPQNFRGPELVIRGK